MCHWHRIGLLSELYLEFSLNDCGVVSWVSFTQGYVWNAGIESPLFHILLLTCSYWQAALPCMCNVAKMCLFIL